MNPVTVGWRVWSVSTDHEGRPELRGMWIGDTWEPGRAYIAQVYGIEPLKLDRRSDRRCAAVYAWEERLDADLYAGRFIRAAIPAHRRGRTLWVIGQVNLYGQVTRNPQSMEAPRPGKSVETWSPVAYPASIDSHTPATYPDGAAIVDELRRGYLSHRPAPDEVEAAILAHNASVHAQTHFTTARVAVPDLARLLEAVRSPGAAASMIHGDLHWRSVAHNGQYLCRQGCPANAAVLFLFAVMHDSQRINDGVDPDHGPRAAAFADDLRSRGVFRLSDAEHAQLHNAIATHTWSGPVSDPTVGACLDADRLDLTRVGIRPAGQYLSTPQAIAALSGRVHCLDRVGLSFFTGRAAPTPPPWIHLFVELRRLSLPPTIKQVGAMTADVVNAHTRLRTAHAKPEPAIRDVFIGHP
ncbi:MAG: hypothetical protein ACRDQZ_03200 [Mycobacteriales bacterium]